MRKKSFAAAAIVAASALLVGVGAVPASADADTLIVWADDERGKALKPVLDGKKFGGKTVEVTTFTSKTALDTALQAATASNGPDLVFAPVGEAVVAAKSGKAQPFVLGAAAKANFPAAAISYGQYKKQQYGLPLDIDSIAMIWNNKFGAAPKTFAEFSTRFKAAKASKKANYGICASDGSWGSLPLITALGGYTWGFKNGKANPTDVGINNPTFVNNLKTYALGANGKSNGLIRVDGWDACSPDWLKGKAMALVTGSWRIDATEAAKIKYTITSVPTLDGTGSVKTLAGWGGVYITTFAKTNSKLAASKAFMNYMASTAGANLYAATVNRPSPHKQVAAVQSKTLKGFAQAMAKTATPQLNNLLGNSTGGSNYYDVLTDVWNRILVKGANPTTVLNKAATVLKKNFAAGAKE